MSAENLALNEGQLAIFNNTWILFSFAILEFIALMQKLA